MERPLALPWRFSARAKCCRTARLEEQSFRLRSRVSGLLWYDYRYGAAGGFVLRMSLGALGIVTWPPTIPFISGETYNACFLQCFVSHLVYRDITQTRGTISYTIFSGSTQKPQRPTRNIDSPSFGHTRLLSWSPSRSGRRYIILKAPLPRPSCLTSTQGLTSTFLAPAILSIALLRGTC
jgi:hypothetical protein